MFGIILKATKSSFQKGIVFCLSIYVKKVMKLLAFIFEQPSYTINQTHYSPFFTTEGSKVRRVYLVAHDMEIRINPSTSYPLYCDSTGNRKLLQSDLSFTCY